MQVFIFHCVLLCLRLTYTGWIFQHKGAPLYITCLFLAGSEAWVLGDIASFNDGELLVPMVPRVISCTWLSIFFRFVWGIALVSTAQILYYSEIRSILCNTQPMHVRRKQKITLAVTGSMYLCAMISACMQPACNRVPLAVRAWLATTCVILYLMWAVRARQCSKLYGSRKHALIALGAMAVTGLFSIATGFMSDVGIGLAVARWLCVEATVSLLLLYTIGGGFGPGLRLPVAAPAHATVTHKHAVVDQLTNNRVLAGHFLSFINRANDFDLDGSNSEGGLIFTRHDVRRFVREIIDGKPDLTISPGILVMLCDVPCSPDMRDKIGKRILHDCMDAIYAQFVANSIHYTSYATVMLRHAQQQATLRQQGYRSDEIVLLDNTHNL